MKNGHYYVIIYFLICCMLYIATLPVIPQEHFQQQSVTIVINSCAAYIDKTRDVLLKSLFNSGVSAQHIHIVIGESSSERDQVMSDGVTHHYRKTYNIDNNGLIWLTQEQPTDIMSNYTWMFYLHDTCYVAPEFWNNVQIIIHTQLSTPKYVCAKLHDAFSMGIGFYRVDWLSHSDVREYMASLVNYDMSKKKSIKENSQLTEDTLFKFAANKCLSLKNPWNVVATNVNNYNTVTPRILEFWEMPGLYKVKANYGKTPMATELFMNK